MTNKHQGSCLCGGVRYQIDGAFESFFLCHCRRCQKDSGSAHAATLFATSAVLTWLQGQALVRTYQHPHTLHSRSFCTACGSALPVDAKGLGLIAVPAGSLDSPVAIRPDARIFLNSKAGWAQDLGDIPGFDELPPGAATGE